MLESFDLEKSLSTTEGRLALGIQAILIVIVTIVVVIIFKKLIDLIAPGTSVYRREVEKSNLSFTESEYKTMADAMFRAMNGWGSMFTNEDTIYRTLGYLKNIDDWKKLVFVYGKDEDGYNMPGRIIYEMSRNEISKVNAILGGIGAQI